MCQSQRMLSATDAHLPAGRKGPVAECSQGPLSCEKTLDLLGGQSTVGLPQSKKSPSWEKLPIKHNTLPGTRT